MRRIFFLSIALSTFIFGSVLAWLYDGATKAITAKTITVPHKVERRIEKTSLLDGIEPTIRGCGNGYAQGYELPDGTGMGEGNSCYRSFKEADKEMRALVKKAEYIIERVAPSKRKGEAKSERVVISFPGAELINKGIRIMWVHDHCLRWINAPSLELALEFEKSRFNPYKFEE